MSPKVILEPRCGQQLTLEAIVRNQLRASHEDGTVHVGSKSTHQLGGSFLLDDPEEAIKGVFVMALLILGELAVVDHPDIDNIRGVTKASTDTTGQDATEQHGTDRDAA